MDIKNMIKTSPKEFISIERPVPLVSICIQTYNQENYIEKCIDSILCQQTDFDFEIILGDDDSSDKTRDICKKYAEEYREKIRLILHSRDNAIFFGKKGTGLFNYLYNIDIAKGKYIAECEGDDFWIDPNKLQKQVDFMRRNETCSLVFTNYKILDTEGGMRENLRYSSIDKDLFDTHYVLSKGFVPITCSLMMKKEKIPSPFPDFMWEAFNGDWCLFFLVTHNNKIGFINDYTSVYREGVGIIENTKNSVKFINGLKINKSINRYTNFEYNYHLGSSEWHYENICYSSIKEGELLKGMKYFFLKLEYSFRKHEFSVFLDNNTIFVKHSIKTLFSYT